jgi:3-(3-hydroxy-phenyl)propionate hydroxylase
MSIENQFTVLIVGAGPVGLAAANYLDKFQIKSLLIDKKSEAYTYPRAIGIDDESLRLLRNLCLQDEDIKNICKKPHVQYFSPNGEYSFFIPDSDFCPFEFPILSTFYQPDLEKLLIDKLEHSQSVHISRPCELINIKKETDYYMATAIYQNRQIQIKANYILACDGGRSTIRSLCGIQFDELDPSEDWMVIDMQDSEQLQININKIAEKKTCKLSCVTINFPYEMRRFEVKINSGMVLTDYNLLACMLLEDFLEGIDPKIIRARIYKRNFCLARKFSQDNIYLLGDAAHLVPPYGGQGMCSGIRDAQNLCWKLAEVVHCGVSPNLLKTYHKERTFAIREIMEFIRLLAKNVKKTNNKNSILSSQYYRKIKLTPRCSFYFEKNSYSGGYLLPSIYILTQNNQVKRLDEILTNQWSILIDKKYNQTKICFSDFDRKLNYIFIDIDKISNIKNLKIQDIYEYNIISLLENGFCLIIRPDLYIFSITKPNLIFSVMSNIVYA